MATRKPQDAIRVCIAETDPRQVLLARYLRETGRITSQLMGAADAFYYSQALAADRTVSDAAVELAVSESVLMLSGQIHRVLNFHRIDRQIVLPSEFLTRCGLVPVAPALSSPAMMSQEPLVVRQPSLPKLKENPVEPLKYSPVSSLEEDDNEADSDEGNSNLQIGGFKVASSVADFLNGT